MVLTIGSHPATDNEGEPMTTTHRTTHRFAHPVARGRRRASGIGDAGSRGDRERSQARARPVYSRQDKSTIPAAPSDGGWHRRERRSPEHADDLRATLRGRVRQRIRLRHRGSHRRPRR